METVDAKNNELKVFISYSRQDVAFADEVVAGLEYDGGFEVFIDRAEIQAGEDWKARLGALIARADTIIFILSPESAASSVCRWEVEEAERLSKRVLPVLKSPLGDITPPQQLAALNYVRFDPDDSGQPRSFMAGLSELRQALRTDLSWVREHTRLLNLAHDWDSADRTDNRLLSGGDIEAAKSWLARQPKDVPEPTELHRDYIHASDVAESVRQGVEHQRAEALRRAITYTRLGLAGALLFAGVAGFAAWIANEARHEAETGRLRAQASEQRAVYQAERARQSELDAVVNEFYTSELLLQQKPDDVKVQREYFETGNKLAFRLLQDTSADKSSAKKSLQVFGILAKRFETERIQERSPPELLLEKHITDVGKATAHLQVSDQSSSSNSDLRAAVVVLHDFEPPTHRLERWKDNAFRASLKLIDIAFDAGEYDRAHYDAEAIAKLLSDHRGDSAPDARLRARAYGQLAWNSLFVGDYNRALEAAQKAAGLQKEHELGGLEFIDLNLAHALLFNGKQQEAERKYVSQPKQAIEKDFDVMLDAKVCHPFILQQLGRRGACNK